MHDAYEPNKGNGCAMQKRKMINTDEAVCHGLMRVVGRSKVSQFFESSVHPHMLDTALDNGCFVMSRDLDRKKDAV